MLLPTQYDVGVDLNDYTPISWSKVKERIEFQMLNNVNCLYWIGHPFGQLYKKSYICNVKSNIINIWRNIIQKKKFKIIYAKRNLSKWKLFVLKIKRIFKNDINNSRPSI